jgi:YD repeat-containing protein
MRKSIAFMLSTGLLSITLLLCLVARPQTIPQPKIESPNVATLDKFGDIPIDLATGTPNISIPIHELHYGNITVPISLRYHPGALRISTHPSWVGLGWDLESGGSITRIVRQAPDEFYGSGFNETVVNTYYPQPISNPPTCGAQLVNSASNWNTAAALDADFTYNGATFPTDVCADEFSFNFMGHTGKFYYSGPTLGWQVASNENIQVQLNSTPLLTGNQVIATIDNEYSTPAALYHLLVNETTVPQEEATQVFSGFTLAVPDGTKYYFGGVVNGNGVGIEFYTAYNANATQFNANTWLLTKIVDVDGNEVDFNYSASYPVADLGIGFNASSWGCQATSGGFLGSNYAMGWQFPVQINMNQYGGMMNLPLYLDNITCPNETISFSRAVSTCLREPNNIYYYNPSNGTTTKFGVLALLYDGVTVPINGTPTTIYGPNNLQWMQLSKIVVTNGNGPVGTIGPNGIGQVYRQYAFNYSSSASQRLTLNSFQESDNTNTAVQKYSFNYNNVAGLPLYSGDMADHWGFYNGQTLTAAQPGNADGTAGSIYSLKQTIPADDLYGLLTQITYPTGGYTVLTWQAHDYSQVVSSTATASRQQLTTQSSTQYGGGSRIGEIQSYLADGTLAHDKKYFYVRGYTNANPNGLQSSGVLNGTPTYFMTLNNRAGINGTQESIQVIALNSQAIYSYNSEGSYLGYDQVVEMNEDKSYTVNYLTSYGPDLNEVSHWDMQPVAAVGWYPTDNYYTLSELDMERGKPVGTLKYNPNDVLVEKTVNTYRSDATRFNSYVKFNILNCSYSGCAAYSALILATANQRFTYDYYVVSRAVTTYDQNGKNPLTTTTAYQYNANNLVSVKAETDSKGETITTNIKYPPDMPDATSQAMTAAHILTPVMQTTMTNSGIGVLLNQTQTNYYSPASGKYKPQTLQEQIGSNVVETRQSFYNYDAYGNINEIAKTNDIHDVYLWGYFGQYPVAKIVGSTLSAVTAVVSQAQINAVTNTLSATTDASVRSLLQQLRTGLPAALVTTYTYLPMTGITSETDPRGETTFYQYDPFQRLQLITDNDGNVLKTFSYQYQIPQ